MSVMKNRDLDILFVIRLVRKRARALGSHTLLFGLFCCLVVILAGPGTQTLEPISNGHAVVLPPMEVKVENPLSVEPWKFFYPNWKQGQVGWLFASMQSETDGEVQVRDLERYIRDPESRIEKEFQVPERLKPRVLFWMQVFAKFSSKIRVVHDRNQPEIIYGYIDMRPLYRTTSSVAAEIRSNNIEKRVLEDLKKRLREAAGFSKTNLLSPEERSDLRNLLSSLGGLNSSGLNRVIGALRTQTGQSDMFLAGIQRSRQLLPHIESVFKQNGLPSGLARIPFIESSFNARAQSKIGAMGLWQFVPETAKQMIHSEKEERWSDPLYQTKGAARLLKMYKNILPDWGFAITAYNSGVGRLRRLSEKYKMTNCTSLMDLPEHEDLGFAGRNFYPEFLAVNIIENYKEEIFRHLLSPTDYSLVFEGKQKFPDASCSF